MLSRASVYLSLYVAVLCMFSYAQNTYADESIETVLAQHVIHEPIKLSYQEIRHMQLLDEPVKSSGQIYISTTYFVLEQEKPQRMVMVTNHSNMWVYDSTSNVKRFRNIRKFSGNKSALGALVLAMRTGETKVLKEHYKVTLSEDTLAWSLSFTPIKDKVRRIFSHIVWQGRKGKEMETMDVSYADGNHTLWTFKQLNKAEGLSKEIKALIKEAGGR